MVGQVRCDWDNCMVAIANETRQKILSLVGLREMCVSELEAALPVSQPTVSYHLAVLRRAHLVTIRREGRRVYYRINGDCVITCLQDFLTQFRNE